MRVGFLHAIYIVQCVYLLYSMYDMWVSISMCLRGLQYHHPYKNIRFAHPFFIWQRQEEYKKLCISSKWADIAPSLLAWNWKVRRRRISIYLYTKGRLHNMKTRVRFQVFRSMLYSCCNTLWCVFCFYTVCNVISKIYIYYMYMYLCRSTI